MLENMEFNLVNRRFYFGKVSNIDKPVRIKIGNTDSPDLTVFIRFFHCPICSVIIAKRLMNKQQINIIRLQLS